MRIVVDMVNRLGFAVQLALLRHPGVSLSLAGSVEAVLVAYVAEQLEIEPSAFAAYAPGRRLPPVTPASLSAGSGFGPRPGPTCR